MKNKLLLMLFLFCSTFMSAANDATKALEFFRNIPKYESINLNAGSSIKLQIHPNYTVSISGDYSSSGNTATLQGNGVVSWDASNNRMIINANFVISGSHSSSEKIYRTEEVYNKGSVANNTFAVLFGGELQSHKTTQRVYDHTEYYHASGSKSYNEVWPLNINSDGTYYIGSSSSYSVTLTGDVTRTISFSVDTRERSVSYGSARSGSNSLADEFGQWKWNSNHTDIWLNPSNLTGVTLHILPSTKMLYFDTGGNTIIGKTSSQSEAGHQLNVFQISFEDGISVDLAFVWNSIEEGSTPVNIYGKYNRFLNSYDYNASSIIDQIKTKQLLMLTYKKGEDTYTAIFELEGLEAIMSYL
ncbi:MAG: hypothetical protein MJZ58_02000 [Paludibacteraceae bacterium]|nr:hypothetical protein [Paludibacteraceae bacterium]